MGCGSGQTGGCQHREGDNLPGCGGILGPNYALSQEPVSQKSIEIPVRFKGMVIS